MSEEPIQPTENQTTKDERTWAMLCHFSAFTGLIFPLGNFLAPLIIWLIKKEEFPFVEDQGKEVLNFQISMTIYLIGSGILCFILIGIPMVIGFLIFDVIVTLIGAVKANDGFKYRYPLAIRFIN